ncbi:MAG: polysaccharide deacetylase [Nakamurella sp.]
MNRGRLVGVVAAVILTIATGVLISQSSSATVAGGPTPDPNPAAQNAESVNEAAAAALPDGAVPQADITADRWITPKAPNLSMDPIPKGTRVPQFIIFSFDGAGSHSKMNEFLAAAAPTDSRITGFLSGTYLLTDDHADAYSAPGARPGTSSIGFGGDRAEVVQRVTDLNNFYALGNEVGTHYNGHFCELGANWSTAEWNDELDQFLSWFRDYKSVDGITDGPDLKVPVGEVKGGRTPCLAGQFDQLTPSWKAHGLTYDSSGESPYTGISWPKLEDGIWQFPIPTVYSQPFADAGFSPLVKAMDYNFWFKFNKATEKPETQPQLTQLVLDTYRSMYQQAYHDNRAPILIANHFNDWNGDSFNPAARQFMVETCGQPETICTTYQNVIAWMEAQDPQKLTDLQDQVPTADKAPATG